ncbi:MAG: UDP-N-acetylglucosamine 2-epimerase (hydrolyzing) [Candidatus Omnitrophica bacterium]|nr:UDP-N-acetylglucosamine 2-epimerase (hydrolyzing) [Candidatus Omnitrophota bacterium]
MGKNKLKKRKICVVTGSRADYGHLQNLMRQCVLDSAIDLQIIATGSHLSKEQGQTYRQVEKDGFSITAKVNIAKFDDSPVGVAKRIGLACHGFADVFSRLKPDIVVVLGDRYEILAATIAAYVANCLVAHLHGGESSQGALDEGFRHAITKMSHIHFAATKEYRQRIIQLGEQPNYVFNFGAPGLDILPQIQYLSRAELSKMLNFDLSGQVAMMTYHPVTLEKSSPKRQLREILKAIDQSHLKVLFTAANMDSQGQVINQMLSDFCKKYPQRYKFVNNLGQQKYMSCLKSFDLMIGNSSSGIIEAPSFALPVINIGDRQKGRIRAGNIIDVNCDCAAIKKGIGLAFSERFRKSLKGMKNPYSGVTDGRASWLIKEQIKKACLDETVLKKEFFDIRF